MSEDDPYRYMVHAPHDRDVMCYNQMTGWYLSRYTDGHWPMNGWDGNEGTWFPVPTEWKAVGP